MRKEPVPEESPPASVVGRFLRRLSWRREVGPLRGEAELEVRELMPEREREEEQEPADDRGG